ncbi:Hsp70 family protein [Clostridium kluyveri]|uniref:Chaperone protein DnaK n=1 Tax=Clostridium kluyveri TaxID=1534 RepID=A0A1L5F4A1_CLOKL|nr:Hsp70 family protein [Clostridium kluyveri]APM37836.1 molecular chaperone DnaK [Clostridium kluyveri]UZQ52163.1 Hsp70 family protein [Clostridium kluyveri]
MSAVVGIDLGTTNSVISCVKRGKVETILLDGKNTFPSVVSISNGKIITGYPAKAKLIMDPSNTVGSTKRDMGKDITYIIGKQKMTPQDIACEILKAIKEKAEFTLGEEITQAVITTPAYFTSEQRKATKNAARKAGFNVLRLMAEPSAAAVSYGINQNKDQIIMVYDLGGGTFDVSIMKIRGNKFEAIAIDGDSRLGGDDFDEKICSVLYKRIKEDTKIDIEAGKEREHMAARQKIKEAAENAKIELSSKENTSVIIPNILRDYHLDFELTRDEYYDLIKPLIDKTIEKVKSVLKDANMTPEDIDRLILVGGATKTPIIREILKKEVRDPFTAPNVDEVVSNGAAILALSLSNSIASEESSTITDIFKEEFVLDEKVNFSYGVALLNSQNVLEFCPVVHKNTLLPCQAGLIAYTVDEYQKVVTFRVFRGEHKELEKDEEIGQLKISITKPEKEEVAVGAIFEMDDDNIIHFTGVELMENSYTMPIIRSAYENDGQLDLNLVEELIRSEKIKSKKIDIKAKS